MPAPVIVGIGVGRGIGRAIHTRISLSDSLVGILLAIPNVRLRVALSMQGVSHESLGPPFSESEEVAPCLDRTGRK